LSVLPSSLAAQTSEVDRSTPITIALNSGHRSDDVRTCRPRLRRPADGLGQLAAPLPVNGRPNDTPISEAAGYRKIRRQALPQRRDVNDC
jgi:hypothetical protein